MTKNNMEKIKEFEGHDANMLLKKAEQLKGMDGESHAIGLLVERLVKESNVISNVRLPLPDELAAESYIRDFYKKAGYQHGSIELILKGMRSLYRWVESNEA